MPTLRAGRQKTCQFLPPVRSARHLKNNTLRNGIRDASEPDLQEMLLLTLPYSCHREQLFAISPMPTTMKECVVDGGMDGSAGEKNEGGWGTAISRVRRRCPECTERFIIIGKAPYHLPSMIAMNSIQHNEMNCLIHSFVNDLMQPLLWPWGPCFSPELSRTTVLTVSSLCVVSFCCA